MNRNLMNLSKPLMLLISLVLSAVLFFGCGDSDDDSNGGAGSSGSDTGGSPDDGSGGTTAGGGGTDNQGGELAECLPQDPPLADPYCHNTQCPFDKLPGLSPANQPKGNCCNTVDVKRMEDALGAGETYDLELAQFISLNTNNANMFAPIIEDATVTRQEAGGDQLLYRLVGVPRSADMEKDASGNPIPVEVTLISGPGKLNCDGTFSFYGPNAALPPIAEELTPNDPSRWQPSESTVQYYGPEGKYLFDSTTHDDAADSGLILLPRWQEDGSIYMEAAIRFGGYKWKTEHMDDHFSCFGSISKDGEWQRAAVTWSYTPIKESEFVIIPTLTQSTCGLYAMGAGQGNCADTPQSQWTVKPTVYCNEESYCWMGSSTDDNYKLYWEEFYEGENGCDATGAGAHPCCDPAGEDSTLPACNAFLNLNTSVLGAVEITDAPVNDPAEAPAWVENCAN